MATRSVTATALRQNLYNILDEVIDSGVPVEIERRGHRLRIVAARSSRKLDGLQRRDVMTGDPESLVHIDWSDTWSGETR
jgi:antitoxin (DNA-binding transcriptional repressor) of toxin-antitoxin stability system